MPVVEEPAGPDDDECSAVFRHRFAEALRAGLTVAEAELWADSDGDVGELRRLVHAGCPPTLLARIVL